MAKINKLIEKLKSKPCPKDFRWADAVKVLKYCGYDQLKSGGTSHRTFYNNERDHMYNTYQPHPKPILKEWMIKELLEIVTWYEKEDGEFTNE